MKRRLVIFGLGEIAQVAHFYFSNESHYEVSAFTVDGNFIVDPSFCGLPVIAFDEVCRNFPPSTCDLFIAISYLQINELRASKFFAARELGYELATFVSPRATVLNQNVIGSNCLILENNTIQPFVKIGDNVILWSGNHIGHHSVIGDHVFISSHVVVSGGVQIGDKCFVGVNATIHDHIKIGNRCVIGASATITKDAAPEGVYIGNSTERSKVPSGRLRNL